MKTALPFHSMDPKKYVARRYSPLYITVVEPDVESLFQLCGLTFTDFFAAVAVQENPTIRIMEALYVRQVDQDDFFGEVANDTTLYSQSFVYPEYEKSDQTDPNLSPDPSRFPSSLPYPSQYSLRPPWYISMLENLLKAVQFSDFDFFDMPVCIIYATLSGTVQPVKKIDEVRKSIKFPKWMLEFITDVPILRVVVYDGLVVSDPPSDSTGPRGAFSGLIGMRFRTKRQNAPNGIDPVTLRNLFRYDANLTSNPQFCSFLTTADIDAAKKILQTARQISTLYIQQTLKTHKFEIDNAKQLKNRIKGMFAKRAPDRLTSHLQVPWRKILYLKLGALYMISGQYENAKSNYEHFYKSTHETFFPALRLQALYNMCMACTMIPEGIRVFKEGMDRLLSVISSAGSIKFLLVVPSICIEFNETLAVGKEATFRSSESIKYCRTAIRKINELWSGNQPMRNLFLALFSERLSGLILRSNDGHDRHSLFTLSHAANYYYMANQVTHCLRCCIWLTRSLPHQSWVMLYQNCWLEKAICLCQLTQWPRALEACKDLLALPDLDIHLHEKVISTLWKPFNDSSLHQEQLHTQVNSLLEVRYLTMTDRTHPSYWGLPEEEFETLIKTFDEYIRNSISRTASVSFDSWYDEDSQYNRKSNQVRTVEVGVPIILSIGLYNRYIFTVHLDKARLNVKYEGDSTEEEHFQMPQLLHKDIPGSTTKTSKVDFKFIPLSEGKFTIDSFSKNYWGYIDTDVECGPLTFTSKKIAPMLKMEISGFPTDAVYSQCYNFTINAANTGNVPIHDFSIFYDNPEMITCSQQKKPLGPISFITVHKELNPGDSQLVEMTLWVNSPGEITFHFCIATEGKRCGFSKQVVKATRRFEIETIIQERSNQLEDVTFHCSLKSLTDEISVIGVIDYRGRFLNLIGVNDDPNSRLVHKNETLSFVGGSADFTKETSDAWRADLLDKNHLAILLKIGENDFYAQARFPIKRESTIYPLKLSIQPILTTKLRTQHKCKVYLTDELTTKGPLYIQPLQFELVRIVSCEKDDKAKQLPKSIKNTITTKSQEIKLGKYNLQSPPSSGISNSKSALRIDPSMETLIENNIVGCNWFGVTRKALKTENSFTTDFIFMPLQAGVYQIPGFLVSQSPNFSNPKTVNVSQTILIIPED